MFLPSISSPTSFSAHRQHTRKNKQQIRYQQKSCLLLAHMEVAQIWWWREGAVEACCRAEGQGLIPSWLASFQPRGTSALLQSKAWGSHPPPSPHPPEDDRCSVRSLQQGESIRHLYNWLRMREKRGKKDGKRDRSRETDCVGVCFHFEWDIGHRLCFSCFVCVYKTKWEILQRQKDTREGKREKEWQKLRENGGWEGRGRGRELAQMRLALTQQDILSHTLHMSSPILSQNQHWSYSVENGPTLLTDETTGISWWCGAAWQKTTKVIQSLSATELFRGFNIRAYPHNRARAGMWSKGVISLGRKDQNFWTATRKNFPSFCVEYKHIQTDE